MQCVRKWHFGCGKAWAFDSAYSHFCSTKESHMEQWTDAGRLLDAVWRNDVVESLVPGCTRCFVLSQSVSFHSKKPKCFSQSFSMAIPVGGHDSVHGFTWRGLCSCPPGVAGRELRVLSTEFFQNLWRIWRSSAEKLIIRFWPLEDTVLHASAGLGNVELISFFMGYGVEALSQLLYDMFFRHVLLTWHVLFWVCGD